MKKLLPLLVVPFLITACDPVNTDRENFPAEESLSSSELYNKPAAVSESYPSMAAAPKYYIGAKYTIESTTYTPAEDMAYNQTGIIGIIPADLNGSETANGETFDINKLSAASKTLPLPSIVKITNLDNGQSAVVRVNDRGPFINSRLMDVSPAVAKKLGIKTTANVQVTVMPDESNAVKAATLASSGESMAQTASTGSGPYTVQAAAFYSHENATALQQRISHLGNVQVMNESGMYKVRIIDLDAASAKNVIQQLRSSESTAPGLLQNGKWINADSI